MVGPALSPHLRGGLKSPHLWRWSGAKPSTWAPEPRGTQGAPRCVLVPGATLAAQGLCLRRRILSVVWKLAGLPSHSGCVMAPLEGGRRPFLPSPRLAPVAPICQGCRRDSSRRLLAWSQHLPYGDRAGCVWHLSSCRFESCGASGPWGFGGSREMPAWHKGAAAPADVPETLLQQSRLLSALAVSPAHRRQRESWGLACSLSTSTKVPQCLAYSRRSLKAGHAWKEAKRSWELGVDEALVPWRMCAPSCGVGGPLLRGTPGQGPHHPQGGVPGMGTGLGVVHGGGCSRWPWPSVSLRCPSCDGPGCSHYCCGCCFFLVMIRGWQGGSKVGVACGHRVGG